MSNEVITCHEGEHNDRNACPHYPRHVDSACTMARLLQAYRNCVTVVVSSYYARLWSIPMQQYLVIQAYLRGFLVYRRGLSYSDVISLSCSDVSLN